MDSWKLTVWYHQPQGMGFMYRKDRTKQFATKDEARTYCKQHFLAAKITWFENEQKVSVIA